MSTPITLIDGSYPGNFFGLIDYDIDPNGLDRVMAEDSLSRQLDDLELQLAKADQERDRVYAYIILSQFRNPESTAPISRNRKEFTIRCTPS